MTDTSFRPSTNGYRFGNSWTQIPMLPNLPPPLPDSLRRLPSGYGLCGGMSLSARDGFLAGRPVSQQAAQPQSATPLFNHIWQKQIESFGPGFRYIPVFVASMAQPDGTVVGVRHASWNAMAAIRAQIDRGRPALIGQIKVSARTGQLWDNHQVLAWGYSVSGSTVTLKIYDPNYPHLSGGAGPHPCDQVDLVCKRVSVGRTVQIRKGRFGIPYPAPVTAWGYMITQRTPGYQRASFPVRGVFHMPV